jgi:hypothetical protein
MYLLIICINYEKHKEDSKLIWPAGLPRSQSGSWRARARHNAAATHWSRIGEEIGILHIAIIPFATAILILIAAGAATFMLSHLSQPIYLTH